MGQPATRRLQRLVAAKSQSVVVAGAETAAELVAEQIRLAAETHSAAAVVMATHGRSGLQRALVGSVAAKVLQDSGIPLVLLPARAFATDDNQPSTTAGSEQASC